MTSLTELSDECLEIARKLRERRVELDALGNEWQIERNTLLGRIDTLEQTLAANGVEVLGSTNPLVVAAHAFAVKMFGTAEAKAAYLRARGWILVNGAYEMWSSPTYGQWNKNTCVETQVRADVEPLRGLAKETAPQVDALPEYLDESAQQMLTQVPAATRNTGVLHVRDKNSGEIIIAQHHPV